MEESKNKTFGELFEELAFDYESKYEPTIHTEGDITYVTFYKTTFSSDGMISRKGNDWEYDPKHFWKIVMMAKLLMNDSTLETLYGV